MTRETKIGLLMGLGFIVVFAVLLLQTGNPPPNGDLQMMLSRHGNSATSRPDSLARLPEPTASRDPGMSSAVSTDERIAESLTLADEPWNRGLPTPPVLSGRPDYPDLGPGGSELTEEPLTPEPRVGLQPPTADQNRVVPTDDVAEPLVRPVTPSLSPDPGSSSRPSGARPSPTPSGPPIDYSASGHGVIAPATYVVQKGDSLLKIARKHYNDESRAVVDFLLKSNSDTVRDRHFVLAGQTLVIPVLPANLGHTGVESGTTAAPSPIREGGTSLSAVLHGGAGRLPPKTERIVPPLSALVDVDRGKRDAEAMKKTQSAAAADAAAKPKDVRNGGNRDSWPLGEGRDKASSDQKNSPKAATGEKRSIPADKPGEGAYRWYTIQPKDTLSQIASKELGGSANWQEIIKLNKNISPTRLKAGDKIRLPSKRKPASGSSKRSST